MPGAVCPSCGVAVVPGYVRCPKCHKPLPRRATHLEGGTALESVPSRLPLAALIAGGVVLIAVLVYFGVRKSPQTAPAAATPVETQPAQAAGPEPAQTPDQPEAPAQVTGPNALDVATDLERALKKQRLWATVSVVGDHVDIRSGSCSDPGMAPMLDGAAPSFKAAGLSRIRCLESSGRVVTTRDL